MAQRFDPSTRQLTSDPFPVADHVPNEGSRYASFSVSENGVLIYARGTARATTRLTWFDRAGNITGTVGDPASYLTLALAPDDRRVAVSMASGAAGSRAIWIIDSARGGTSRLTFDAVDDASPVWSPDGTRIAFHSVGQGESSLRQKIVSGTASDELLLAGQQMQPTAWSPDGRLIAFGRNTAGSSDIWILPLSGDRKPFALYRQHPPNEMPRSHRMESGSRTNRTRQGGRRYTSNPIPQRVRNISYRPAAGNSRHGVATEKSSSSSRPIRE